MMLLKQKLLAINNFAFFSRQEQGAFSENFCHLACAGTIKILKICRPFPMN